MEGSTDIIRKRTDNQTKKRTGHTRRLGESGHHSATSMGK